MSVRHRGREVGRLAWNRWRFNRPLGKIEHRWCMVRILLLFSSKPSTGIRGGATMKSKTTDNYQYVLRAIGQGLESLEVKSFDLDIEDNEYVVQGEGKKKMTGNAPKSSLAKAFLSLVLNGAKKRAAKSEASHPFRFTELRFGRRDIELLERKGKVSRSNTESSSPNPHNLSQILRTVGAYLDQDGCRLVKISWRDGFLKLWYINRYGFESKDILSPLALYDWWVHQYKQRRTLRLLKRTGND